MFCLILCYCSLQLDHRRFVDVLRLTRRDDSDTTTSEAAVGSAVNEDLRSALREEVILLKEMPSTTTKAGSW